MQPVIVDRRRSTQSLHPNLVGFRVPLGISRGLDVPGSEFIACITSGSESISGTTVILAVSTIVVVVVDIEVSLL